MAEVSDRTISLVVGLGNPGPEYTGNRHNVGFMVVDRLLELLPGRFQERKVNSGVSWQGRFGGRNLTLLKPMTFMNLSGKAVAAMAREQQLDPTEIFLVYDDVDLPLGRVRMRRDGSSGGHRGVESVIAELGSQAFPRLRVGIAGEHRRNQIDFVLGDFAADERELAGEVVMTAAEATKTAICRSVAVAMNSYNGLDLSKEKQLIEKNS